MLNTPRSLLMPLCTASHRPLTSGRRRHGLARTGGARHTGRVHRDSARRLLALSAVAATAVAVLTGCSDSSTTGPTVSAAPTEIAAAKDFCSSMLIATEAAAQARNALSRLYDEMATDEITNPSHNLSVFTTAGADVVTYGTAYVNALDQVRDYAEPELRRDLDAISEYWESYAIPVGQMASEAKIYADFVDAARSLIESPDTAALRTAQIEATDEVSRAYARACSTGTDA